MATKTQTWTYGKRQTVESRFAASKEHIECAEEEFDLLPFTSGSEKQIMYGRGLRARMIKDMVTNLDHALVAFARDVLDPSWWIALSMKDDKEAWIMNQVFSLKEPA